jgi:hypothetical protein
MWGRNWKKMHNIFFIYIYFISVIQIWLNVYLLTSYMTRFGLWIFMSKITHDFWLWVSAPLVAQSWVIIKDLGLKPNARCGMPSRWRELSCNNTESWTLDYSWCLSFENATLLARTPFLVIFKLSMRIVVVVIKG